MARQTVCSFGDIAHALRSRSGETALDAAERVYSDLQGAIAMLSDIASLCSAADDETPYAAVERLMDDYRDVVRQRDRVVTARPANAAPVAHPQPEPAWWLPSGTNERCSSVSRLENRCLLVAGHGGIHRDAYPGGSTDPTDTPPPMPKGGPSEPGPHWRCSECGEVTEPGASPKAAPSDLTQARAAAHVDGGWEALYGPDTRSAAYHEARARAERLGLEVAPEPESYRCGCADCPGLPWAPSRSTPHPCGRAAPAEPVVYELGGWYEPGYSPGDLTPEPERASSDKAAAPPQPKPARSGEHDGPG